MGKLKIRLMLAMCVVLLMSFSVMMNPSSPGWKAPASANALKNPFSDKNAAAIKNGGSTFKLYCVACHGTKGKGDGIAGSSLTPRPADLLSKSVADQSDGAIFWKISNGKTPMPGWKASISATKRWELVTYIRHLETKYGNGYHVSVATPAPHHSSGSKKTTSKNNSKQTSSLSNVKLGKLYLKKLHKNELAMDHKTGLFMQDGKPAALYYDALVPDLPVKGVVVLLPDTGETPEDVLNNNIGLAEQACDSNLLTIVPSLNGHLYLDSTVLHFLNSCFSDVIKKYKVAKNMFILGGMAQGGLYAFSYTESAYKDSNSTVIRPEAVFAADPVLSLSTQYLRCQKDTARDVSSDIANAAKAELEEMNKKLGAYPQKAEKYQRYSAYAYNTKAGGNAGLLKGIPVRIYCDPDISWYMKNRHEDYYDMNAADQTAMINQLCCMGNKDASFVDASGKGQNLKGARQPQSWSVIDAKDCIQWMRPVLAKKQNVKHPK